MKPRSSSRRASPAARGSRGVGPAFLLAQLGAHAASKFAERLRPLELAPPHAGILRVIAGTPGLSQQALGAILGILPSRLVILVDELETRDLIERRDSPEDRRVYELHLTDAGKGALEAIGRVARAHQDALCAALSEDERQTLAALLSRIAEEQDLTDGVHPGFQRLGGGRPPEATPARKQRPRG